MANMSQLGWLGLGVLGGFLLDWAAIYFSWNALKPYTKPLAMILLISWTVTGANGQVSFGLILLIFAQIFGLLGDILLLFSNRFFMTGIAAFLIGHLFYLALLFSADVRFLSFSPISGLQIFWHLLGLVLWAGILILVYKIFRNLPNSKNMTSPLWAAIQVYLWILSAMLVLSVVVAGILGVRFGWHWLLPVGSALFLLSDSLLTYNRFMQSFNSAQFWVRISYHLAQISLAGGFIALINPAA